MTATLARAGTRERPASAARPSPSLGRRQLARRARIRRVPALAIFTALVVGGIVIVFTDPDTLDAWSDVLLRPGRRPVGRRGTLVSDAYKALFESSLGSADCHQPDAREATPLLFAGLSVASPSGPGCSTSARPAS